MNPWPVAHTLLNGQRFKVYEAELCEENGNSGEVIGLTKRVGGSCRRRSAVPQSCATGRKTQNVHHRFLNGAGRQLKLGDRFGS